MTVPRAHAPGFIHGVSEGGAAPTLEMEAA